MEHANQPWVCQKDEKGVLWIDIQTAEKTNVLNTDSLKALDLLLDDVAQNTQLTGVVFYSSKPTGFIAGADIHYFSNLSDVNEVLDFVKLGQRVFDKLANLKVTTLAVISGNCLGGGLELALACRYRIAELDEKTKLYSKHLGFRLGAEPTSARSVLEVREDTSGEGNNAENLKVKSIGLPEIKLGIIPAWGGIRRLAAATGVMTAMSMILPGKIVDARTAAKLGVIDVAVPKRVLQNAIHKFLDEKPAPHKAPRWQRWLEYPYVRSLCAKFLRRKLAQKIKQEHYPAPFAVIENWEKYGSFSAEAAAAEVEKVRYLINEHDTAKNLIRVFQLQEKLKSFGKQTDFAAEHVHVIGAGTMGGDIAAWCALKGMRVTLQDQNLQAVAKTIKRARELFKIKLKQERLIQAALDRLIPDVAGDGIRRADVIIEAVIEDLKVKQELFQSLESRARPDALLATNTSSLLLETISQGLHHPERLVGIHFFNPVSFMQLVEVVHGEKTNQDVYHRALNFVRRLDRLPLPVKSSPGFLVNRVLMPYLMESMHLLEEGVPPALIDKAAEDFGMPMGPVELADTVGLDVCLAVAKNLNQYYGGQIPERLNKLVSEGYLGRKTKQGFYTYEHDKAFKEPVHGPVAGERTLTDRLILRMVREAEKCLREQVVADQDLVDAGMIFGAGFAPFRGGLMHYATQLGTPQLQNLFQQLEHQYGERFK